MSNHGGRQLDQAPASLDALPAIKAAVGDRMTVMLDSGVRRGADILIALCLGAQFVTFGRPTLYGAVAGGLPGVKKAIDIFRTEIDLVMGQIGCPASTSSAPTSCGPRSRGGTGNLSTSETKRQRTRSIRCSCTNPYSLLQPPRGGIAPKAAPSPACYWGAIADPLNAGRCKLAA